MRNSGNRTQSLIDRSLAQLVIRRRGGRTSCSGSSALFFATVLVNLAMSMISDSTVSDRGGNGRADAGSSGGEASCEQSVR